MRPRLARQFGEASPSQTDPLPKNDHYAVVNDVVPRKIGGYNAISIAQRGNGPGVEVHEEGGGGMKAFTNRSMLVAVFLGLICTNARAQTYVVPPGNAGTGGTGGTFSLLTTDYTGQEVYSAALLSGLPNGAIINGFRMRLAPGQSTVAVAVSSPNFDISIGPSNFHPGSLTTSTVGNQGAGTVLARSGPITFPANSFIGGANPNPFGPLISFTTPYTYTGGDLLFTFSDRAFSSSVVLDAQAGLFSNAQGRQNVGLFNSSTVPQNVDGFAIILQLNYVTVPEPSTWALCGVTLLAGLGYWSYRQRRIAADA